MVDKVIEPSLHGVRVGVVADPNRFPGIYRELSLIGVDTVPVRDGAPLSPDWDILLLYRNARTFHRYEKILERWKGPRPRTVLWQHEPLLPDEMPKAYEMQALQAARAARSRRWNQPIGRLLQGNHYRSIAAHGLGLYSAGESGTVSHWKLRSMTESYAFIKNGFEGGWLDQIFVSTVQKQKFLANRNISSRFAPIGLASDYGENRNQTRDIDILFLGDTANSPDRRYKLAQLAREFKSAGYRFEIIKRGLYGEERTRLLNRTKIVLHLHNIPWDTPWKRWNLATANGAMVVSEPLSVSEPFEPGHHYVEAPPALLAETIMKLLDEPQEIAKIARECSDIVHQNMLTRHTLVKLLSGDENHAIDVVRQSYK